MKAYQVSGVLILVMMVALLAAGCGKPAEPPSAPIVNNQVTEPVNSTPAPPAPSGPVKTPLSQEILDLIAKSKGVSSYEYTYKNSENSYDSSNHYVKGDKLRMIYGSMRLYNKFSYYDVYIDKTKGLAYLVCQDVVNCKGKKGKEVMYPEFNHATPLEVLAGVNNGEKVEETEVGARKAWVISYINPDGDAEKIWLWTYKGMPLKREIIRDNKKITINYDNLVVDPQTETSVELPSGLEMM
jgi:hypothetical protein